MSESAQFLYQDAQGEISEQSVRNCNDKGFYFSGYSETHRMVRTFRKDRVLQWFAGGHNGLRCCPELPTKARRAAAARAAQPITIVFTGFAKGHRADLEAMAADAGMAVRKSVSQKLDFLCTGPNAGPRKMMRAHKAGSVVLDDEQFMEMLETGALPLPDVTGH